MNKGVNNSIPEDTISRAAAIDALDKCHCGGKDENGRPWIYKENAVEAIEMVEPSQSAEPKRGKWIDRGERGDWEWQADGRGKHWHEWECNICHHYFAGRSFFCPHCGSDMRGVTT